MAKCTISTRPHDKASICETFAAIRGGEILCKFYKLQGDEGVILRTPVVHDVPGKEGSSDLRM